jgi:hypothetical protein
MSPWLSYSLNFSKLHKTSFKTFLVARCWWLRNVILATQGAGIRRITVQSQPGQIVVKTVFQKKPNTKQGFRSGSKPQYYQKKKKKTFLVDITENSYISWWGLHSPGISCSKDLLLQSSSVHAKCPVLLALSAASEPG